MNKNLYQHNDMTIGPMACGQRRGQCNMEGHCVFSLVDTLGRWRVNE